MNRHSCRVLLVLWVGLAALLSPRPAEAIFRFDEIEPREFEYNEEYFINLYSYRMRLSHRWEWPETAIGYRVTAGSLRTNTLYLHQEAKIRLPFGDRFHGQYRFVETEDYDARYERHEVEFIGRFYRPPVQAPLSETLGRTPAADGFFLGGLGVLDDRKEFADVGLVVGYNNWMFRWRADLIRVDNFFNAKNKAGDKYTRDPLTVRSSIQVYPHRNDDLVFGGWIEYDKPLRLVRPFEDQLIFRYWQLQGGLSARWRISDRLRFDFEIEGERTVKIRRSWSDPDAVDDLERAAMKVWLDLEWDVDPVLAESSSRSVDTWLFGIHGHVLEEDRDRFLVDKDIHVHRGEAYGQVGYVLGIPSPSDSYDFGVRAALQAGFLSIRDVRFETGQHTVSERIQAKSALGLEVSTREGHASAFFQFTFRLDEPEFGGGNGQVVLKF